MKKIPSFEAICIASGHRVVCKRVSISTEMSNPNCFPVFLFLISIKFIWSFTRVSFILIFIREAKSRFNYMLLSLLTLLNRLSYYIPAISDVYKLIEKR